MKTKNTMTAKTPEPGWLNSDAQIANAERKEVQTCRACGQTKFHHPPFAHIGEPCTALLCDNCGAWNDPKPIQPPTTAERDTKHTPGPWRATCPPVCAARLRYIEGEDFIVAEIVDPVKMSQAEGLANARLIVAAPDLLDACLSMEKFMVTLGHTDSTMQTQNRVAMRGIIERALATARGHIAKT